MIYVCLGGCEGILRVAMCLGIRIHLGFHKQTEVAVILKELEALRVGQNLGDVGRAAVMSSKLR